jgi:hypothetical protein
MLFQARRPAIRLLLLVATFGAPISLAFVDRLGLLVLIWLATAIVVAVAATELWPGLHVAAGVACVLVGGALTWAAAVSAFFMTYVITISASLCGDQTAVTYPIPALAVYAAGGSWALAGRPRRALLGWPAAVLVAAAVGLAVSAALPGTHGYCET